MKIKYLLFFITYLFSSASVTLADVPWSSSYWWHDWSQRERNQDIVDETYTDVNKKVGLSCKEWVRKAVYRATGNHVTIPATQSAPSDYLWQNDSVGHVVGMSISIDKVSPGHIIQMKLKSGWPHTAIVLAKTSTSVTFVESNWDSTPSVDSDAYVRTRTVSFTKFYTQLISPNAYSVYFIQ